MDRSELRIALRGVIAFAPTLFDDEGAIDLDAQAGHVAHLAEGRVGAVVVTGGVGEFYALTRAEFEAVVSSAVEAAAGRVPVIAGIGHSTVIAADLAGLAASAGADGLMVNPFYFVQPESLGAAQHYQALGDASGLGLMVFSTHGSVYDADALEALAEVDAIVAVKDEFGDLDMFAEARRRLGDRYVWINGMAEGPALEYARRGAVAMTSGIVNLDVDLAADVWAAAERGDSAAFETLHSAKVAAITSLRTRRPGYHITVIKEAMSMLGSCRPHVRLPLVPLRQEERDELRTHLEHAQFPRPVPA